jgi:uncharacterized protein (DUF342 family)
MPGIKGSVRLDIDRLGLEARVTLTPGVGGTEVSPDTVRELLSQRGVSEGVIQEEIERAFRTVQRKAAPVVFIAARGLPPQACEPEACVLQPLSLPANLKAAAERIISGARPPEVFRVRLERVRAEKNTGKRAGLFSKKQEAQPVWEMKPIREPVSVDPAVSEKGYVRKGSVVAGIKPAVPGKDGRSIYGKTILVPRAEKGGILLGANTSRTDTEVKAAASGILRKGADWLDVIPFQAHEVTLSVEGATCHLSFAPGSAGAPPLDIPAVLAEAAAMGFGRDALIPEDEIRSILDKAVSSKKSIVKHCLTPSMDSVIAVTVSPDRMRATLSLRKGRGAGRKLALAEVGEAIRNSGVKGFDSERVKKDILAFYNGRQFELQDYTLAVGQPPEKGEDGRIELLVEFLKKAETDAILRYSEDNSAGMAEVASRVEFPLAAVESIAIVKQGVSVLHIVSPGPGRPGLDVMKTGIPAVKGDEPKIKFLENLKKKRDVMVSEIDGIVETGTVGGVTFVRVRPHRDGELRVTVSEDRMKGLISFFPAQGTGKIADYEEVRAFVEKEGITQGLQSETLLKALDAVSKNLPIRDLCIAQGKPPRGSEVSKPVIHVQLATGSHVAVLDDGRADFKNQDTITQVAKGTLLATLPAPGQGLEDGWDVTGKPIPAVDKGRESLQAGKNVGISEQPDGSARFYAGIDGELSLENGVLEVKELHTIAGDVDLGTGNVKFKGKVRVKGSVLSGFTLVSGDDAVIDEVVQAAFVSSDGSIWVGHGIKGEGRAILRARGSIMASFAEQAALISMGDIRLNHGCIRCQVKCNGKLILESEKGVLMGGRVKVKHGATVFNLGSAGGARTEVSFGQDYVVQDQIEREIRELDIVRHRIAELDAGMKKLERGGAAVRRELEEARQSKLQDLKELEQRNMRILGLRDRMEEHFPSEIVVRGTMFPGAVVESHGRLFSVTEERSRIALQFDATLGRIVEKPAK